MIHNRLIIVDDDAVTRRAVVSCFSADPNLEVIACQSSQQVMETLWRNDTTPDWLVVDWNMPGMNGYELVCAVRSDSRFDAMRIIMLTAETSLGHVRQALEAGADEYLMKPFTKEMLLGKLALLDFQ